MNQDKARDFFSSYYDGTLEGGLRQQFEQRLATDRNLAADYSAFVETVNALDSLRDEEIEIPLFLSDRIATRLEREESRKSGLLTAWNVWFKGIAVAGLATAAIVATFFSMNGGTKTANAGLLPSGDNVTSPTPSDRLTFEAMGRGVKLVFRSTGVRSVVISAASTGQELQHFKLNGNSLESPLTNSNDGTAVVRVTATGDGSAIVALPGKTKSAVKAGSGTINEFAAALASHYAQPVVVRGTIAGSISWTFDNASTAREAATTALNGRNVSIDQRDGGLITILNN